VVAAAVAVAVVAVGAAIEDASSPQTIGDCARNFCLIFLQQCILQVCRTKILRLRGKIREQRDSKFCQN